MARDYAKQFYSSKAWQDCRNRYASQARHLCENCMAKGIIRPGEIVHHKIPITADNIEHPEITLEFTNLMLLCRDCHAEMHKPYGGRRYHFDSLGNLILNTPPISDSYGEPT